MSEAITTVQEEVKETTNTFDPFAANSWADAPIEIKEDTKQESVVQDTPVEKDVKNDEQVVDPKDWVKNEFGWDDVEAGKKELEELRALKAKPVEEKKFVNETSEKLYNAWLEGKEDDVYSYLAEKKKLEKYTSGDIDKQSAAEIIKLNMQKRNKDLTTDDVDFLFNKKFSYPEKPVQDTIDTDEEYQLKLSNWEKQIQSIEKELVIEAKLARPELEKYKSELVLPEIKKETNTISAEEQQKELQRQQAVRDSYIKSLESDYKNFNGYETKYKDEEVEIPVSFGVSEEEKVALKKELENFDVDAFIEQRWFGKDGSPNIQQMMSDVTLLRKGEAVLQKIANEVGAKMREHYIKLKTNVSLNGNQQRTFDPKNGNESLDPFKEQSWSDKVPVHS